MQKTAIGTLCGCALAVLVLFSANDSFAAKSKLFDKHKSIGMNSQKGKVKYDSKRGEYRVTGGGSNMWFKTDAFELVYTQVSGDVSLTSHAQFVGKGIEQHRKAALIVRQTLEPDSAYVDVALHGDGLTSLQYRTAAGEDTKEIRSEINAPEVIRIERHGNQFTIAAGRESEALRTTGPATVEFRDPVYIGLAVCSHNKDVLETAVFSNIKLERRTSPDDQASIFTFDGRLRDAKRSGGT